MVFISAFFMSLGAFWHFFLWKKFRKLKKWTYLCSRFKHKRYFKYFAKIAQLVEHDLAKVGVAGSSPVFRSKYPARMVEW